MDFYAVAVPLTPATELDQRKLNLGSSKSLVERFEAGEVAGHTALRALEPAAAATRRAYGAGRLALPTGGCAPPCPLLYVRRPWPVASFRTFGTTSPHGWT